MIILVLLVYMIPIVLCQHAITIMILCSYYDDRGKTLKNIFTIQCSQ